MASYVVVFVSRIVVTSFALFDARLCRHQALCLMYLMPLMSTRSGLMLRLNVLHVVGYEIVGLELSERYIGYLASPKTYISRISDISCRVVVIVRVKC